MSLSATALGVSLLYQQQQWACCCKQLQLACHYFINRGSVHVVGSNSDMPTDGFGFVGGRPPLAGKGVGEGRGKEAAGLSLDWRQGGGRKSSRM
jgi:hypothetical protein